MSVGTLAAAGTFTTAHIAATAAISGALALLCALLLQRRRRPELAEGVVIGVLVAAAVFLWRKSANMPQLNNDGLNGFSANDWLAPTVTFVVLGVYRNLRPPGSERRFGQAQALATLVAFVVNVVTI
jgi:hypothetical protein